MFFLKSKISILGVVLALGSPKLVLAVPQQTSISESMIKNARGHTSTHLGHDQISKDKQDVDFTKVTTERETVQANASRRREAIRAALISRRLDRIADRDARLSPEERGAIRRQIREARIDIYRRNNQKRTQSPD